MLQDRIVEPPTSAHSVASRPGMVPEARQICLCSARWRVVGRCSEGSLARGRWGLLEKELAF
eukprot:8201169-Pyramimonas_sp.AAC.1